MMSAGRDRAILLESGEGRAYDLGDMRSVFKADGAETNDTYSVSEWWLEPGCRGPGAHSHAGNDDTFYVLEGTVTFYLDGERIDAGKGSFVRVPPAVQHDFENNTGERAGFLNIYVPGGFEADMPGIVQWFAAHGSDKA